MNRLALGTVQLGQAYGIANAAGQVPFGEAVTIVRAAEQAGLDTLDTAIGYGESETRLGRIGVGGWKVVTKLPALPGGCDDVAGWVHAALDRSLARLGLSRVYGLLLHRAMNLAGTKSDALYRALVSEKEAGRVAKIGVSVYEPSELEAVTTRYAIDLVQAPFNVFDRRLTRSGWLERLRAHGIEVHTRSAFLQGLLLIPASSRPAWSARWTDLWRQWDEWLRAERMSVLQGALGFVLTEPGIDRVVVGVDSSAQLAKVLAAAHVRAVAPPPSLATEDPNLINPSRWPAA